jgi:hypothetical protein
MLVRLWPIRVLLGTSNVGNLTNQDRATLYLPLCSWADVLGDATGFAHASRELNLGSWQSNQRR